MCLFITISIIDWMMGLRWWSGWMAALAFVEALRLGAELYASRRRMP
jgi:uncharacterized membrane protein YpjA